MNFSYPREISTVMSRQGFHQGIARISLVHPQSNPLGLQLFKSHIAAATDAHWGDRWALIP